MDRSSFNYHETKFKLLNKTILMMLTFDKQIVEDIKEHLGR